MGATKLNIDIVGYGTAGHAAVLLVRDGHRIEAFEQLPDSGRSGESSSFAGKLPNLAINFA